MKKKGYLAVAALLVLGSTAMMQRPDLAASLDGTVNLPMAARANAADSGTAVDISGYACVAAVVITKQVDLTTTSKYVVLEDSTAGTAAWNLRDSIAVDSTDGKYYDLTYRGALRYVRLLQRASGAAGDTIQTAGVILKGCKRAR